jgi:hypothetical protein
LLFLLSILAFLEVVKYGLDVADVAELGRDHEGRAA